MTHQGFLLSDIYSFVQTDSDVAVVTATWLLSLCLVLCEFCNRRDKNENMYISLIETSHCECVLPNCPTCFRNLLRVIVRYYVYDMLCKDILTFYDSGFSNIRILWLQLASYSEWCIFFQFVVWLMVEINLTI